MTNAMSINGEEDQFSDTESSHSVDEQNLKDEEYVPPKIDESLPEQQPEEELTQEEEKISEPDFK